MKVLWFTNTPSRYDQGNHNYHGGGWIESLEKLICEEANINLAVSFFYPIDNKKKKIDSVVYYPVHRQRGKSNPFKHILNAWQGKLENELILSKFVTVIDDFKPDIIHVFGTEGVFGLIQKHTKIPVVIHLQGLINPCLNSYFPPGFTQYGFLLNAAYFVENLLGRSPYFGMKRFKSQAKREEKILKNTKYVMGRTSWDKSIVEIYNKDITYYHVDEVLRSDFYDTVERKKEGNEKIKIITTISGTIYKGIDLILKTASLLINTGKLDFEWNIIGLNDNDKLLKAFERKLNLNHKTLNIKCLGRKTAIEIRKLMLVSDLYIHPSYIDNSPNSLCEAQIVGLPVIACNVGGVSTMVQHNINGKIIPSNGVYELCYLIQNFNSNEDFYLELGKKGKEIATKRHNKVKIKQDLLNTYKNILKI